MKRPSTKIRDSDQDLIINIGNIVSIIEYRSSLVHFLGQIKTQLCPTTNLTCHAAYLNILIILYQI